MTAIVSAVFVSVDTATSSYTHQNSKETITQSDKDGGRVVFGDRGLKVSDRKIKDSSSSEFTLLVCVTQDSSGTGLLLSVRTQWEKKKKTRSLSTHEWAASTSACACICDILRVAFVLAPQCDF